MVSPISDLVMIAVALPIVGLLQPSAHAGQRRP